VAADQRVKVVYLAPRPAQLTADQFRTRWKAFGELAMSLPLWRHVAGYAQCDPVAPTEAGIDQRSAARHGLQSDAGGVGLIWFHSGADLQLVGSAPGIERMRAAELELFGAANEEAELVTAEHLMFERGRPTIELI